MCVLVIALGLRDDLPLVVAANRDESYDRAATPPEIVELAGRRALLPRDLRAGGTWEGLTESGLVVVITNRPDGDFEADRPSRGNLCRTALAQPDAHAVRRHLESELERTRYNSFNLFYADDRAAFISSWNGELHTIELGRGAHVLSNEHGLGELYVPELDRLQDAATLATLRCELVAILGSHDTRDANGFMICKHGERYGTVSSSLIFRSRTGDFVFEHASGPPCTTGFETCRTPR
ncbi:MAG: NRDE family protein [Candidatus Krumholzibacteriia bacterium]